MAKEGSVAPKERINITFKPATGGAQEEIELPLKLMVLGDFTQQVDERKVEDRKPINIDKNNFDEVFPTLSALAEGFDVFVVTDSSGTFNTAVQQAAWNRMTQAGAQMMNWFSVACELQRDWRNDIEGLGNLLSQRIPNYRNLMNSYSALTAR